MTLVSEIITDAYRQSNLVAVGGSPTTAETTEALRYLNRIVLSVFGNEVGDPLTAFPLGDTNIVRPSGFPYYDANPGPEWFVPKNARVVLNLNNTLSMYLHPMPNDGTRFAVNDIAGSLATSNVTVYGNGRTIENATSVILSTAGLDQEWFFRADTGNWVKSSPLLSSDTFPFPSEFDDFFITLLAGRINPSNGTAMDPQSQLALDRARTQLRARYKQEVPVSPNLAVIRLPNMSKDTRYNGTGTRHLWQPSYGDFPVRYWNL